MTQRQPGSTIKPISVYAPAVESGLVTPYTIYTDMPATVIGDSYWPKNYDTHSVGFRGQVTIMEAVQRSINTIPVQLVMQMTPERALNSQNTKWLTSLVEKLTIGDREHTDMDVAPIYVGEALPAELLSEK